MCVWVCIIYKNSKIDESVTQEVFSQPKYCLSVWLSGLQRDDYKIKKCQKTFPLRRLG